MTECLPVDAKIFTLQELIVIHDEAYQQGRDSMERWHDYIYDEGIRSGRRGVVEWVNKHSINTVEGDTSLFYPTSVKMLLKKWLSQLEDWGI